ncbi:MAG: glycerol-3-phosphate dehydrogenase [Cyanobacteriota bacterium]|nr:glycerol-3-phosphate dehydrogenase [Cyanobacteriota bacterium]
MSNSQFLPDRTYDLVIVGGGINGAGVARDAALRGLNTILLEKEDFASGSSSWSTRLVHGGLRYLEYFEFPLVRESLREREILLRNAPHLVHPLLLTIPIYGDRSRPYWKIWAGMLLYDVFSFDKTLPQHRMLPDPKFRQLFRSLDTDGLRGGAQYYDAQVSLAERLCWENILAAREAGATALNYTEVTQLHRQGDRIASITCRDRTTEEEFTIQCSDRAIVVNTAGPWVDRVCNRGVENGDSRPIGTKAKIGGTKGSHIIVETFPGAPDTALYVEAKSDGRPFFIVPWLGMFLIGTTDLPFEGNLDRIKADNDEIDYLLKETNLIIPTANLSRQDVKFTYSGVRPLPNAEGQKPGSITRKHILVDGSRDGVANLISLVGGKLTTYRNVAEEIVDLAYQKMGRQVPPCPTQNTPLPGAILPSDPRIQTAIDTYRGTLSAPTIDYLFSVYGARAIEVLKLTEDAPELAEQIIPQMPDIKAQIVFAVRSESARTFLDITRHRTTIAMQADYGLSSLEVLAEVLKKYCDWSTQECDRQTLEYHTHMKDNCIPDYAL